MKWTLKGLIDNKFQIILNNYVRVITSGCNSAIENSSVDIEYVLFELPRVKDSKHLLDIIDNINSMFLPTNTILIIFDIFNMFPNIDNKFSVDAVKSVLLKKSTNSPPVECILEGLGLCLTCKISIFDNRNFLQTGGAVQGPHMSCSYSNIAMSKFNTAALQYHLQYQHSGKNFEMIF